MSNNRCLQKNIFYHVYNRGYNKQTLFFSEKDYTRFYAYLKKFTDMYLSIEVKCHCILPNHFHFILLETGLPENETGLDSDDPDKAVYLSIFMRKLQVSYSMYFNSQYGDSVKKGLKSPVFEGRFKAKEVLDEAYLAQLVTYVEHNAVKHEIVERIEDWPYTSHNQSLEPETKTVFFSDFD